MDGVVALESYPCSICGSAESRVVMKKQGVVVTVEFTLVACASCGHVRVDPRVADERLDELYDAAYYRGRGFDRTIDYDAEATPASLVDSTSVLDTIAEARGGSLVGARYLDVGCGTGGLLEEAQRRGALAFGSDSSAVAAAHCTRKGLTLLTDEQILAQQGSFDVVSAVEVIEHVPDPKRLVAFLRSCVRVGGVVFIGTGNWNLVRRQPGTPYVMPEGHIQYFTPDRMRRLFADARLGEAAVLNRTWFLHRVLPERARPVVPSFMLEVLARVARRLAPGFAPFPVGVRAS